MKPKVADVMTVDVMAVSENTPFKEIVGKLKEHGVNAVPVVDPDLQVLGIVSTADLLFKTADPDVEDEPHTLAGPHRRRELHKAEGTVARDFMTAPAITIAPDTEIFYVLTEWWPALLSAN